MFTCKWTSLTPLTKYNSIFYLELRTLKLREVEYVSHGHRAISDKTDLKFVLTNLKHCILLLCYVASWKPLLLTDISEFRVMVRGDRKNKS